MSSCFQAGLHIFNAPKGILDTTNSFQRNKGKPQKVRKGGCPRVFACVPHKIGCV